MKRSLGLLAAALIVPAACGTSSRAFDVEVNAALDVEPLVEPLPVTVGVYYSPEFRDFTGTDVHHSMDRADHYHVALGEPSVVLFDWVLSALFDRTLVVPSKPPLPGGEEKLDGIVEPRIKGFTVTSVSYEITLYAPSGELIASLPVDGTYFGDVRNAGQASDAISYAMRNASAELLVELPRQPEIRQWLAGLEVDRFLDPPTSDPGEETEGNLP